MHFVWTNIFIMIGGLFFILAMLGIAVYYFIRRML